MHLSDTVENPILLVENNPDDILLVTRAFQRAGVTRPIQTVTSGLDAIAYFKGEPPFVERERFPLPALVLLDIKMPLMDGFEVLRWIRRDEKFSDLCVVMLTSSDLIRDANQAYQLGANSFLVKPLDFENAADLARFLTTLEKEHLAHTACSRASSKRKAPPLTNSLGGQPVQA